MCGPSLGGPCIHPVYFGVLLALLMYLLFPYVKKGYSCMCGGKHLSFVVSSIRMFIVITIPTQISLVILLLHHAYLGCCCTKSLNFHLLLDNMSLFDCVMIL